MPANLFLRNESRADRAIRVLVGLGILSLTVVGPQTAWALLGAVPLATGLAGTCPLYSVLGFKTASRAY